MSAALKLALSPLLLAQALRTRKRMPRLPEAAGPREGEVGRGRLLPLLVLGDSSAAGVGVDHQRDALAPQLAKALSGLARRRVHWWLRARSGVNTAQALALLKEDGPAPAELAVVVTGVNDVVDQLSPARAQRARAALRDWLRSECGVRHIVFTPLPPMHRFAGLPQPLRWVAGRDARAHDRALAHWAQGTEGVTHLPLELPMAPDLLASDGFHPGAAVYRLWAQALAECLAARSG
jgi:lysophospholipase L1-like esterase